MSNDEKSQPQAIEPEKPVTSEEDDNKVLRSRFASDIAPRGGGNRVSAALEKAGRLFGAPLEEDDVSAKPSNNPVGTTPTTVQANRPAIVVGRGGWAAIIIFVLAAVTLFWAISTIFDLNSQLNGYKTNFGILQNAQTRDAGLISLVNSPELKTYQFQVLDPVPEGAVSLHIGNQDLWGLSFTNLNNVTAKDRFFGVWAVRKTPKAGASDYIYITSFGGGNTSAGLFIIPRDKIPNSLGDFGQLVVSDEPLNQAVGANPTGAVRYRLDLAKVKQS